jgi:hypothetical protein
VCRSPLRFRSAAFYPHQPNLNCGPSASQGFPERGLQSASRLTRPCGSGINSALLSLSSDRLLKNLRCTRKRRHPTTKLTDSRPAVNAGNQSDALQPERIGSRRGWRLFGGAFCYTTFRRLDSPVSGGTLSLRPLRSLRQKNLTTENAQIAEKTRTRSAEPRGE